MRLFNIFIIIFLAIVALKVNGIFSFLELCLTFLIVWLTFTERYSFFILLCCFFLLACPCIHFQKKFLVLPVQMK